MDPLQYWLIIAFTLGGGVFAVVCAWQDYEWFMNHRKARLMVRLLGRNGTRIFYAVIGTALAIGGAFMLVAGPAALG
jgi:hypothetical protein